LADANEANEIRPRHLLKDINYRQRVVEWGDKILVGFSKSIRHNGRGKRYCVR
jgi:hypothetical protein